MRETARKKGRALVELHVQTHQDSLYCPFSIQNDMNPAPRCSWGVSHRPFSKNRNTPPPRAPNRKYPSFGVFRAFGRIKVTKSSFGLLHTRDLLFEALSYSEKDRIVLHPHVFQCTAGLNPAFLTRRADRSALRYRVNLAKERRYLSREKIKIPEIRKI